MKLSVSEPALALSLGRGDVASLTACFVLAPRMSPIQHAGVTLIATGFDFAFLLMPITPSSALTFLLPSVGLPLFAVGSGILLADLLGKKSQIYTYSEGDLARINTLATSLRGILLRLVIILTCRS